jgi:hypothetical protein
MTTPKLPEAPRNPAGEDEGRWLTVAEAVVLLTTSQEGRPTRFPDETSALQYLDRAIKAKEILAEGRPSWWWRGEVVAQDHFAAAHRHDRIADLALQRSPDGKQFVLAPFDSDPFAERAPSPDDPQPHGYMAGTRHPPDYRRGTVNIPANSTWGATELRFRREDILAVLSEPTAPAKLKKAGPPWYMPPPEFDETTLQRNQRWEESLAQLVRSNPEEIIGEGIRIIAKLAGVAPSTVRKAVSAEPEIRERAKRPQRATSMLAPQRNGKPAEK